MLSKKPVGSWALATVALLLAARPFVSSAYAAEPGTTPWRETFSGPLDWVDPFDHDARLVSRVYGVRRDGDVPVLHALHDDASGHVPAIHYGKAFLSNPPALDRVRALRWRWRVLRHPDVEANPWADVAASVYVVIHPPSVLHGGSGLKFGWLAKPGAEGTHQHGLLQIALDVGGTTGEWRSESVDLCALYRRAFGRCEGESVRYVGVVTDADDTRSVAEAEYADFELTE